jgi:uncharacterized SAM-binding protein YcdF (DUF218 family)
LFLVALFTKKEARKRLAFRSAIVLLLFFTNPFIISELMKAYEAEPVQLTPSQTFNAGILLGGMVSYSSSDKKGYFNNVSDRFIQTALLYKKGHINNIIVAAGNGFLTATNFSEAGFIKQHLVQLGVPPERIFTDSASRNTLENSLYAKRLADSAQLAPPFLLISSAMHLPRAAKLFRKAGMHPTIYPCNFLSRGLRDNLLEDYLLPSAEALNRWENLLKELAGTLAYWFTGRI